MSFISRQPDNNYFSQLFSSSSIVPLIMQHISFDELNGFINSSHQLTSPASINGPTIDCDQYDTMNKHHSITLESIRDELRLLSNRLARVEQSTSPRTFIPHDSRPASTRSFRVENSEALWAERLQADEEIKRLKLELAIARAQINNNQSTLHSVRPLSSISPPPPIINNEIIQTTSSSTGQLQFSSTSPSAFKPVQQPVSDDTYIHNSKIATSTNITTPNIIRPPSLSIPPTPPLLPATSMKIPSLTSTQFMMNVNNTLPTFTGAVDERPVKFITEFEIRAASLVGHDDIVLLHTVQQSLCEGALIWFSPVSYTHLTLPTNREV